jgi:hypothetical protein
MILESCSIHRAGRGIPITGKWRVVIGEIRGAIYGFREFSASRFVDEFGTSVKICQMAWSLPYANFGRPR